MTTTCDVIVIGAGIAGASAGAELALAGAKVILLEKESQPGYHSTGRSAATYIANYGNATIRKLNRASLTRLATPPAEFAEQPFLSPRGALYLAQPGDEALLDALLDENSEGISEIAPSAAVERVAILRPDKISRAAIETDARDIDVNRLHQCYLRQLRHHDGQLFCHAGVSELVFRQGHWQITSAAGRFDAPVVVNAAGAWADQLALTAGIDPIGLTPMRRTAAIVPVPGSIDVSHWPLVYDLNDNYYFKPEAGKLLISPSDETPVEPCDAWPDELDLARGIDHFEQSVTLSVDRVEHRWAGLRTFAPDRSTVVGFEPAAEGFFWLAGQGGYGIQTSPAMSRLAASLVQHQGLPAELQTFGLTLAEVSPQRFRSGA